MDIVVGLGNPGQRYRGTRHNVGFMVIERLAQRWQITLEPVGTVAVGRGYLGAQPVALVKPLSYMNLSGEALASMPQLPDAEWIVVHDDLDLPCGRLRLRRGGGSGGHRGVDSIVAWRGPDFVRVRFGIGRPAPGEDAIDFVLAPFGLVGEHKLVEPALQRAAEAVETLIRDGLVVAMNRFNQPAPDNAGSQ